MRTTGIAAMDATLAVRSIAWTVVIPGIVVGYLPWRFFGLRHARFDWGAPRHLLAAALMLIGTSLFLVCVWEFARRGRGTLSPLDPPRRLVVRGLYRYVRNPMYLSGTLVLLGEVALTGSRSLLAYWAVWFTAVNLFVIAYEEPTLRRQFGAEYDAYCARVGRWLPRFRTMSPT
jgi:protein-S-isoprenylcysteine O-methyltransferase Ste14